ncbi:MAG: DHH family phosphoesterase [Candidatus Hodarchaeales archaeon]
MLNQASFFEACHQIAEEIQKSTPKHPFYIFSHLDADGLTSASILSATLSQIGINYQVRILDRLEYKTLDKFKNTFPSKSTVIFSDLGTGVLEAFLQWDKSINIFILDHHSPSSEIELTENVHLLNPHHHSIDGAVSVSSAGIVYFVSTKINLQNKRLSPLALIGALGDRQDQGEYSSLTGLNKIIVEDAKKLDLITDNVSVWFFDRTRSIISILRNNKFLGFENELEIRAFLNKLEIPERRGKNLRNFYDLSEEEYRRLASELIVEYKVDPNEIYKRDYQLIQEDTILLRDARVFVTKLNACGRLQRPDVGVALCLGDRQSAIYDLHVIEDEYSRSISQGLKWALSEGNLEELEGIYFLDGQNSINERIIGTILSILSSKRIIKPKPLLGCAKTSSGKLKISMRLSRFQERKIDLSSLLFQATQKMDPNAEVGGHAAAAGAIISQSSLNAFVANINQLVLEGS